MADRRDALLAAAETIVAVEQAALDVGGGVVATVGDVKVVPGSMSVVPGAATLLVDIRDVGTGQDRVRRRVEDEAGRIGGGRGVDVRIEVLRDEAPTPMSTRVVSALERAAASLGTPSVRVPSLSGHDAITISRIADVGMLFVRNASGRSHSPSEQVALDDIEIGAKVLLAAVVDLAT
jgi:acetylornithine deacetylase/succinyl-diaminopimelate desuccinylase-like protein